MEHCLPFREKGMPIFLLLYLYHLFFKFRNLLLTCYPLVVLLEISIVQLPFSSLHCAFQDLASKRTIDSSCEDGDLYLLNTYAIPSSIPAFQFSSSVQLNKTWLMKWHNCMGHMSFQSMKYLFPTLFSSVSLLEDIDCEVCQLSKHVQNSYPLRNKNKSSIPFSLVHYDVCGPSLTTSLFAFLYFVTFFYDYTWCTWVYSMKTKDGVYFIFQTFHKMVQIQFDASTEVLRFGNGEEYISSCLQAYLTSYGIEHQTTCVGTSQQNGVAECKNQHLLQVTRALLFNLHVPKTFLSKASNI